jgi:hypothetical protein
LLQIKNSEQLVLSGNKTEWPSGSGYGQLCPAISGTKHARKTGSTKDTKDKPGKIEKKKMEITAILHFTNYIAIKVMLT